MVNKRMFHKNHTKLVRYWSLWRWRSLEEGVVLHHYQEEEKIRKILEKKSDFVLECIILFTFKQPTLWTFGQLLISDVVDAVTFAYFEKYTWIKMYLTFEHKVPYWLYQFLAYRICCLNAEDSLLKISLIRIRRQD